MGFVGHVSYETIYRACFNYWEPSFIFDIRKRKFIFYHSKHPIEPQPNIVVAESLMDNSEIYLRTFLGKSSSECVTEEETKHFFKELKKTVSPLFLISETDLEKAIEKVVDDLERGIFSIF